MYEYSATVVEVHDGDTMWFNVDLGFDIHHQALDVRLFGIDCPELGRPDGLGEKARDFVKQWMTDHPGPLTIQTFKDRQEKYGRYLAVVLHSGTGSYLVNDLLAAGLAKPYSGRGPRPIWP